MPGTSIQGMSSVCCADIKILTNALLFLLGPPTIILHGNHNTTFSLLPPAVNRADIPILTQNVILSTNLVGNGISQMAAISTEILSQYQLSTSSMRDYTSSM